jgi:hypothetical protein
MQRYVSETDPVFSRADMTTGCQELTSNGARCPVDYCRSYLLNPDKWTPHFSHKERNDEKLNERILEQTLRAEVVQFQYNKNCVNAKVSILIQPTIRKFQCDFTFMNMD